MEMEETAAALPNDLLANAFSGASRHVTSRRRSA
jgi:hypothetical protein